MRPNGGESKTKIDEALSKAQGGTAVYLGKKPTVHTGAALIKKFQGSKKQFLLEVHCKSTKGRGPFLLDRLMQRLQSPEYKALNDLLLSEQTGSVTNQQGDANQKPKKYIFRLAGLMPQEDAYSVNPDSNRESSSNVTVIEGRVNLPDYEAKCNPYQVDSEIDRYLTSVWSQLNVSRLLPEQPTLDAGENTPGLSPDGRETLEAAITRIGIRPDDPALLRAMLSAPHQAEPIGAGVTSAVSRAIAGHKNKEHHRRAGKSSEDLFEKEITNGMNLNDFCSQYKGLTDVTRRDDFSDFKDRMEVLQARTGQKISAATGNENGKKIMVQAMAWKDYFKKNTFQRSVFQDDGKEGFDPVMEEAFINTWQYLEAQANHNVQHKMPDCFIGEGNAYAKVHKLMDKLRGYCYTQSHRSVLYHYLKQDLDAEYAGNADSKISIEVRLTFEKLANLLGYDKIVLQKAKAHLQEYANQFTSPSSEGVDQNAQELHDLDALDTKFKEEDQINVHEVIDYLRMQMHLKGKSFSNSQQMLKLQQELSLLAPDSQIITKRVLAEVISDSLKHNTRNNVAYTLSAVTSAVAVPTLTATAGVTMYSLLASASFSLSVPPVAVVLFAVAAVVAIGLAVTAAVLATKGHADTSYRPAMKALSSVLKADPANDSGSLQPE